MNIFIFIENYRLYDLIRILSNSSNTNCFYQGFLLTLEFYLAMNASIMGIFYYIIITFYVILRILFNYIVVSCNNRKTETASELTFGNENY